MAAYRIKFGTQFASYNPGEIAWFSAGTGQALVTAGVGTAVDALPAVKTVITKPATVAPRTLVTHSKVSAPVTQADSDINQNEAGIRVGD